ncbi:hypothetical protein [Sneathiella sp.]|jgi:hypothetical protein|uniref:hypothetical protein n=1 Tax=Sneathiella sp. TaxID=1964365 RepID=UPI0039E61FEF
MNKIIDTTTPIQRLLIEQNENFNNEIDERLRELESAVKRLTIVVLESERQVEVMKDWLRNWMSNQECMFDERMTMLSSSLRLLEERTNSVSECSMQFDEQENLLRDLEEAYKPQESLLSGLKDLIGLLNSTFKR